MRRRSSVVHLRKQEAARGPQATFHVQLAVALKDQRQHRGIQQVGMHRWIETEAVGQYSIHQVGMALRTHLPVHIPLLLECMGFGLMYSANQTEEPRAAEGVEATDSGVVFVRAVGIYPNPKVAQNLRRPEVK